MTKTILIRLILFFMMAGVLSGSIVDDNVELVGMWYGTWQSSLVSGDTGNLSMSVSQNNGALYGIVNIPALMLFDTLLPVTVDGNSITIGVPEALLLNAILEGNKISGTFSQPLPVPPHVDLIDWQMTKYQDNPGPGFPEPLPPLFCLGNADYSDQLVTFEPVEGQGYLDYPVNDESWENQYRSYLRRDLMFLVKYATAKVAQKTAAWNYGHSGPLGLGDMSEADGAIPGTSVGFPGHPEGTHTDGRDIDTAYYQLYAPDNLLRAICDSTDGDNTTQHCVDEPYALDRWRTALFLAYLSEHPRLRAIGVDGKAGLVLEGTLDELVQSGLIASSLRARIPLRYEVTDHGYGWYNWHVGHLHISMNPLHPILEHINLVSFETDPNIQDEYVTAYLELVEGYEATDIDIHSLALILDGHNLLYATPWFVEIDDYNENHVPDLMIKFNKRIALQKAQADGVEITVMGSVHGQFFQGTDTISVMK